MAILKVNDDGSIGIKKNKNKKKTADLIVGEDGKITFNADKVKSSLNQSNDIAPVRTDVKRSWFKSGLFEDGYDFGDITKTILGTNKDFADDFFAGVAGIGEGVVDTAAYAAGGIAKKLGKDEFAKKTQKFIERDLVEEYQLGDKLARQVNPGIKGISLLNELVNKSGSEKASVLGEKTDSLVQSGGQLAGTFALQSVGVPWWLTTGVTSFGGGTEEAFQNDATYGEAGAYGLINAGAEILTEKIFGGIKFGGKALDEGLKKKLAGGIANKTLRTLTKFGWDMAGEGTEEVLSDVITNIGKKLTYEDEATLKELVLSEEAMDGYLESFIGGAVLGGGFNVGKLHNSIKTGRDYDTGLTDNEQSVIDAEVSERSTLEKQKKAAAQKEQLINQEIEKAVERATKRRGDVSKEQKKIIEDGVRKGIADIDYNTVELTKKEIAEIQKQVNEDLRRGAIDTFRIENTIYQEPILKMRELSRERATANETRQAEIDAELKKLNDDYNALLDKNGLLKESYVQRELRKQAFEPKLTGKETEKELAIIENVKELELGNDRATHEMVDFFMKVARESDYDVSLTNNNELEDMGEYKDAITARIRDLKLELKNETNEQKKSEIQKEIEKLRSKRGTIDGFIVEENGKLVLNVDSPKAMNVNIGHELTHAIEKSKHYDAYKKYILDYAKTKGVYDKYYNDTKRLYNSVKNADVEKETVSFLTGDYVFTDQEFVSSLSIEQPNIFKQAYDYIKHVYKIATAGSKEARQLERAKRMFDKAYKEMSKATTGEVDSNLTTEADSNTVKYSLEKLSDGTEYVRAEDGTFRNEDGSRKTVKEVYDILAGNTVKTVDGENIYILKRLPGKEMYNELFRRYPSRFKNINEIKKLNEDVNYNFEELLENSSVEKLAEPDLRQRHEAQGVENFDTRTVNFYDGNNAYRIDLSIAKLQSGEKVAYAKKYFEYDEALTKKIQLEEATSGKSRLNLQTVSGDIINDSDSNVNTNAKKKQYSLSEADSKYDSAVKSGDIETAQRLVDEAAKNAGYTTKAYHGTLTKGITEFKKSFIGSRFSYDEVGFFFTDNFKLAEDYATSEFDADRKGEVISAYIKTSNAFIFDKDYAIKNGYGNVFRDNDIIDVWDNYQSALLDEAEEMRADSIIVKDGQSMMVVAFEPNQIKSAEPITYDNNGNVIPLSERFNAKKRDIRFSLSAPVEETKDLMAIHNLHVNEVLKQLDLGGMPMPSVAITDPSIVDHEGFGDVTLILHKDAIDPKKNKDNKVYSGDAYTPTFPPISYKANEAAAKNIENRVRAVFYDIPDYYRRSLASFRDIDNINHALNSAGGEQGLIERYKDTHDLKQLYLAEKGKVVPVVVEEIREEMDPIKVDSAKAVIEALGEDTVRELIPKTRGPHNIAIQKEWADKHQEELKEVYTNLFIKDGFSKEDAKSIVDEQKISFWLIEGKKAADYLQTGGVTVKQKEDFAATNAKIDSLIPEEDYQRWVKKLFTGIEDIAGIRNKKDTFTPAGNRRSFEALHDPVTLENIVKAMRGDEQQKGQGALGGNFSGASVREYKSIKDIKGDSQRLGKLTKEEHDANNQYISDTLNEIAQRYANGKDWVDARNTLVEAVALKESKQAIKNYLKQYDYVYKTDDYIVDDLIELRDYVRGLTVPYFEAKPQRAVGFDEVGVFVIPNNADAALKQKLLESGYSIAEYNPDIEGDRQRVVNEFEKYKFSLYSPSNDIAPVNRQGKAYVGGYAVYGSDMKRLKEEIAPIREDIQDLKNTLSDLRENVATLAPEPEGYKALTEEDLPYIEQEREESFRNITEDSAPVEPEYYNMPDTAPLDDKSLKLLSKNMRQELGLKNNQVAGLRKIIQDFSTSETASKEDLYNAIESEFGTIYEKKKLDTVQEIKAALRSMRINVSDTIKSDIPDYFQFKQRNFGKIRFANDGLAVDDVYEGLKDIYPEYFPDDIANPTDQLLKIADVVNMDANYIEEYALPEEQIQDVTDYIYESISDYKRQKRQEASENAAKAPIDESMIPYEVPEPVEDIAPVREDLKHKESKEENNDAKEPEADEAPLITKTRKELRKALLEDNKDVIMNALENAKNLSSPLMNNTDTIRLSEMVFGRKAGSKINEIIFQRAIDNEAKSVAWQNKERSDIKDLGIKPRSKESAAVQKWGEGEYVNEFGDVVEYTDSDLMLEFPNVADQKRIKDAAIAMRKKYDEYIEIANNVLTGLGFKPIEKRKNYFMHFQELGDFLSKNGIPFNPQSMKENNLPTDINGLTEFFVPQKKWFASMNQRKGKRTVYDAVTGIDKYISGVADIIYHTEDIQRGRAFEELIRDTYGQGEAANANRSLLPEELQMERLKKQQDAHLSKYARWLHNWTDNLAGKKNRIDRAIEDFGDRAGFSILDTARKQVSANMIGFNLSSSLTNLIASVQAMAKTNKVAVAKGTADTIRNIVQKDDFISKNSFLTNRFGSDMLSKNWWQKAQDAGFIFMKGMDWFSANQIVRSKFYELRSKGMSEEQAHAESGKFAARIMGDRTKGANAMFYNSKLFNVVGQFQLEVNNQLYSMFYDTYHESKEKAKGDSIKTAAGITFTLGQLFVMTHIFGQTFKAVAGYNPTFDVIGIIATALGLGDDDDDNVVDNLQEAADQLLDALPYSNLMTGGGRIPLSSAIPDIGGLITGGKDNYGNDLEFSKEMAKLPYLLMPAGYGQIKKTTQGLKMFDKDNPVPGSYTDNGNLRFPVEDTPFNRIQAGLFGQWSNENAREYFDNERQPLKEKQIQEYKDLDLPIADYWKYRDGLKEQKTLEDKFNYIADLDLPVSKKNIMINNIVDRKEKVDMINYDDFSSYEEFDFATKNPEKYSFLESMGVSYKDYKSSDEAKEAYDWAFNNPEKYSLAKAAAGDVVTYRSYASALNELKADKDSNGKTISGSRKAKVAEYINGLSADYGEKIILFKSEYPSDDTYNYEIIDYLNNREDITYSEMETILKELGFTVDAAGNVRW